jgi:hypothetical protein
MLIELIISPGEVSIFNKDNSYLFHVKAKLLHSFFLITTSFLETIFILLIISLLSPTHQHGYGKKNLNMQIWILH